MNIALSHYRTGETDGVSLEMEKWKKVLEDMGHRVVFISGSTSLPYNITLKELDYRDPEDLLIEKNAYVKLKEFKNENELVDAIKNRADKIKKRLKDVILENKIDLIIPNNILSIGRSIPTAIAFTEVINELKLNTIGHHHDFWWERESFSHPTCDFVRDALLTYYPPNISWMKHVVINTPAKRELKKRRGIDSFVIPNVFDFSAPLWDIDDYNKDFREVLGIKKNDIIMLQATRVTNRKAIELAIDVIGEINSQRHLLEGKRLYNGEIFTSESKIIHLLVGMIEGTKDYVKKLLKRAKEKRVDLVLANEYVDHSRGIKNGHKVYSLWDTYVFSDIITYPSIYEGWGNQFLEGVFAKRPMIVFEYSVYEEDIKPKGFKVISLGNRYTISEDGLAEIRSDVVKYAARESIRVLLDREYRREMVEENFAIGKKYFSYDSLQRYLREII